MVLFMKSLINKSHKPSPNGLELVDYSTLPKKSCLTTEACLNPFHHKSISDTEKTIVYAVAERVQNKQKLDEKLTPCKEIEKVKIKVIRIDNDPYASLLVNDMYVIIHVGKDTAEFPSIEKDSKCFKKTVFKVAICSLGPLSKNDGSYLHSVISYSDPDLYVIGKPQINDEKITNLKRNFKKFIYLDKLSLPPQKNCLSSQKCNLLFLKTMVSPYSRLYFSECEEVKTQFSKVENKLKSIAFNKIEELDINTETLEKMLVGDYNVFKDAMEESLKLHGGYRIAITSEMLDFIPTIKQAIYEKCQDQPIQEIKLLETDKTGFQMGMGGNHYDTPYLKYPIKLEGCHSTNISLSGMVFSVIMKNDSEQRFSLIDLFSEEQLTRFSFLSSLTIVSDQLTNGIVDKLVDEARPAIREQFNLLLNDNIVTEQALDIYFKYIDSMYDKFIENTTVRLGILNTAVGTCNFPIHKITSSLQEASRLPSCDATKMAELLDEIELSYYKILNYLIKNQKILAKEAQDFKENNEKLEKTDPKKAQELKNTGKFKLPSDLFPRLQLLAKFQKWTKTFEDYLENPKAVTLDKISTLCGDTIDAFYLQLSNSLDSYVPELDQYIESHSFKKAFLSKEFSGLSPQKTNYRFILALQIQMLSAKTQLKGMETEYNKIKQQWQPCLTNQLFFKDIKIIDCSICHEAESARQILLKDIDKVLMSNNDSLLPTLVKSMENFYSLWPYPINSGYAIDKSSKLTKIEKLTTGKTEDDKFDLNAKNKVLEKNNTLEYIGKKSPLFLTQGIKAAEGIISIDYFQDKSYSLSQKQETLKGLKKELMKGLPPKPEWL